MRFSVTDDTPNRLLVVYVVEKDHAPAQHGKLEYVIDDARLDGPPISEVLAQQARAFLESYLSRPGLPKSARTWPGLTASPIFTRRLPGCKCA